MSTTQNIGLHEIKRGDFITDRGEVADFDFRNGYLIVIFTDGTRMKKWADAEPTVEVSR